MRMIKKLTLGLLWGGSLGLLISILEIGTALAETLESEAAPVPIETIACGDSTVVQGLAVTRFCFRGKDANNAEQARESCEKELKETLQRVYPNPQYGLPDTAGAALSLTNGFFLGSDTVQYQSPRHECSRCSSNTWKESCRASYLRYDNNGSLVSPNTSAAIRGQLGHFGLNSQPENWEAYSITGWKPLLDSVCAEHQVTLQGDQFMAFTETYFCFAVAAQVKLRMTCSITLECLSAGVLDGVLGGASE